MARGKSKADRAEEQLEHLRGILPVEGEPSAPAPARLDAAVARSTAASSTRTRMARRAEMEIWEKNPRRNRTARQIRTIAKSMKAEGQDETIIVRPHPDPEKRAAGILWQIITGGTRWEASAPEYADMPLLRIEVRDLNDKEALKLAWRNNKKRNDMGPLDDAYYYLELSRMEGDEESDKTLRAVAQESGVSHGRVKQFKDLLTLPEEVLLAMMDAEPEDDDAEQEDEKARVEWNEKHGRALLQLQKYPDEQHRLFMEIKRDTLSGNGALRRADKLLDDTLKDAGIERKPKKTRKSKGKSEKQEAPPAAPPATPPTETPDGGEPAGDPPPPQAGGEPSPPADTTAVTTDVTPGTMLAPPVVQSGTGTGTGTGAGALPPVREESRFEPAVVAVEELANSLENWPLSAEDARRVGFLHARLRRGVEKIGAHLEIIKGGL